MSILFMQKMAKENYGLPHSIRRHLNTRPKNGKGNFSVGNNITQLMTYFNTEKNHPESIHEYIGRVPGIKPFGRTPSGDVIGIDNKGFVVMQDHETGKLMPVNKNYKDFLRNMKAHQSKRG